MSKTTHVYSAGVKLVELNNKPQIIFCWKWVIWVKQTTLILKKVSWPRETNKQTKSSVEVSRWGQQTFSPSRSAERRMVLWNKTYCAESEVGRWMGVGGFENPPPPSCLLLCIIKPWQNPSPDNRAVICVVTRCRLQCSRLWFGFSVSCTIWSFCPCLSLGLLSTVVLALPPCPLGWRECCEIWTAWWPVWCAIWTAL